MNLRRWTTACPDILANPEVQTYHGDAVRVSAVEAPMVVTTGWPTTGIFSQFLDLQPGKVTEEGVPHMTQIQFVFFLGGNQFPRIASCFWLMER